MTLIELVGKVQAKYFPEVYGQLSVVALLKMLLEEETKQ